MWWEMSKPSKKTTDTFDMRRSLESDSDTMLLTYEHWCPLRFLRMNIYVQYIQVDLHLLLTCQLDAINVFVCKWLFWCQSVLIIIRLILFIIQKTVYFASLCQLQLPMIKQDFFHEHIMLVLDKENLSKNLFTKHWF